MQNRKVCEVCYGPRKAESYEVYPKDRERFYQIQIFKKEFITDEDDSGNAVFVSHDYNLLEKDELVADIDVMYITATANYLQQYIGLKLEEQ